VRGETNMDKWLEEWLDETMNEIKTTKGDKL
jgi:hypothetical protein